MKGMIPFLWNSFWMWLRKLLCTSSPRKLMKTRQNQLSTNKENMKEIEKKINFLSIWFKETKGWGVDFGKAFRRTCVGRTEEVKEKWRQAFATGSLFLSIAFHVMLFLFIWTTNCLVLKICLGMLSLTPWKDFDELLGMNLMSRT